MPANNSVLDPGEILDRRALQENTALETNTVTNHNTGSNDDVGSNTAVLSDLGSGVDKDVAAVDVARVGVGKGTGVALVDVGEVEAGTGQKILGLTNIHPEALERERMKLVVGGHGGEGLLLDRGGLELNTVQNSRVEDVDTSVDLVANKLDGLLDEAVDH